MAHSGLALKARSAAGAAGAGGGAVTCTTAAGSVQFVAAGDPARTPSAGSSRARVEMADIEADTPAYAERTRTAIPIAQLRFILHPATAPTPSAEFAACLRPTMSSGLERRADRQTGTAFRLRDRRSTVATKAGRARNSRPC